MLCVSVCIIFLESNKHIRKGPLAGHINMVKAYLVGGGGGGIALRGGVTH